MLSAQRMDPLSAWQKGALQNAMPPFRVSKKSFVGADDHIGPLENVRFFRKYR